MMSAYTALYNKCNWIFIVLHLVHWNNSLQAAISLDAPFWHIILILYSLILKATYLVEKQQMPILVFDLIWPKGL
jgi:hypothetical protein